MREFLFFLLMLQSALLFAKSETRSSKALNIARTAEYELDRHSVEGTTRAVAILEQLTQDAAFRRLQNDERIKIYKMQLDGYMRLKLFEKQLALLENLLQTAAFSPYWISLKVGMGHSFLAQDKILQAAKVTKELLRIPTRRLSTQDAKEISELHIAIERHREQKLYLAKQAYAKNSYEEAAGYYQYLFDALVAKAFSPTLSKTGSKDHFDLVTYRLALCYFMQKEYRTCTTLLKNHPTKSAYILHGLAEKRQNHFDKAYEILSLVENPSDKIVWETAYAAYKAGKLDKAKELLQKLEDTQRGAMLEALIDIQELNFKNAKRLILLLDDPKLKFEVCSTLYTSSKDPAALAILESCYPDCPFRDKVLYALQRYQELYTNFPDSPLAPESYYKTYPEQLYIAGDLQAIGHLKKMAKSYYKTPYGVVGRFIWTAFEREESTQPKILEEVIETLDSAINDGIELAPTMPPAFSIKIVEAEYSRLQAHFSLAQYDEVVTKCSPLKESIAKIAPEEKLHLLWQEASFLLYRAHLLQANESRSREELVNLLEYAAAHNSEKGEAYVLALLERANQKMRDGDLESAFCLLNKAQILQADGVREDLGLEILIAKSQLHRKKGEIDKAMILLSNVINEKSASNLRIQAMYIRAELYECKGRRDLALRQLQTTAKKGGEWGMLAAKKLEDNYGY